MSHGFDHMSKWTPALLRLHEQVDRISSRAKMPDMQGRSRMVASRRSRALLLGAGSIVALYVLSAYVVLPLAWTHFEHQPQLAAMPMQTRTAQDIPGDPLNVGLAGNREDVVLAMH